ncbi:hypothetical protein [Catellatospora vulcania]|uniref:hypothetical protein n=1 Tax=Catellatospora vulcania TaxID=1460450 RepID=UPI0012D42D07|nr:hypothetical protein [Catellatospora vulcania]
MRDREKDLFSELMRRFVAKEGARMSGKSILGLAAVGLLALLVFVGYRLLVVELIADLRH